MEGTTTIVGLLIPGDGVRLWTVEEAAVVVGTVVTAMLLCNEAELDEWLAVI